MRLLSVLRLCLQCQLLVCPVHAVLQQRRLLREQLGDQSTGLSSILKLGVAKDVKRQMLTVDLMGGLGNQLFQLAALLSYALDSAPKFSVVLPNVQHVCCNRSTYWESVFHKLQPLLAHGSQAPNITSASRRLRGEAGKKCILEQVPGFDPYDDNCTDATTFDASWVHRLDKQSSCDAVHFYGYFQNPAFFSTRLSLLQDVFWDKGSASLASKHLARLLPGAGHDRPMVSVHYRLSDYDRNGWVLDQDYYDAALLQVTRRLGTRT
jgi:hypothetical protein